MAGVAANIQLEGERDDDDSSGRYDAGQRSERTEKDDVPRLGTCATVGPQREDDLRDDRARPTDRSQVRARVARAEVGGRFRRTSQRPTGNGRKITMPVRRNSRGKWIYRKVVKLPNGKTVRIFGTPDENTRKAAEDAEQAHVERVKKESEAAPVEKKEVPTFDEWFNGRFWQEWVIANQNKPGEMEQKKSIYESHLKAAFGNVRL